MSISPDELRAQRELVKRHLDWLDARISEVSGSPAESPGAAASQAAGTPSVSGDSVSAAPLPEVAVEAILETHSSESGLSQGAKLGCVAVAAFIVLGFLFILFVLPRFLYGDRAPGVPEEPAGETQPG